MSERFGTPAAVNLAFAVAPAVAIAGDSESSSGEKVGRVAELQREVNPSRSARTAY